MKIGIDLGGSHIGIGLVDDEGNILKKEEMFIKEKVNIERTIEEFITEKVMQIARENDIESIGIAVPGTVSNNKLIKAVNLGIENYDLATMLEEKLNIKVKLRNDAKCAALAEQKYGNMQNYENALFLCIGTGIGGAIIFDGKLLKPKKFPRLRV